MKYLLAISIVLFSCVKPQENNTSFKNDSTLQDKSIIDNNGLTPHTFDIDKISNAYIISTFNEDFEGIKETDIMAISLVDSIQISDFGFCKVFKLDLSKSVSNVFSKSYHLVYSEKTKKAVLVPIIIFDKIQFKVGDSEYLISGYKQIRDKVFYIVYKFVEEQFVTVFDSSELSSCENGIPVANYSLDCISYDLFKLNKSDLNNDGFIDLKFIGDINFYCEGLETGFGKNDRKPIKTKSVEVTLINQSNTWALNNDDACNLFK